MLCFTLLGPALTSGEMLNRLSFRLQTGVLVGLMVE